MCRWFAYLSQTEPCLIEDVLITPEHSLCRQVNENYLPGLLTSTEGTAAEAMEVVARNRYLNIDGFGVAYYTTTRAEFTSLESVWPVVYKCSQPPLRDPNFRSIAAHTSTSTLFAHIRASTSAPVVTVNNHPFNFGRHLIMHNGEISDFHRIRLKLLNAMDLSAAANIAGSTDTEHFAALYMTHLCRGAQKAGVDAATAWEQIYDVKDMKMALIRAMETVFTVQRDLLVEEAEGNSLNVCVTDGKSMVAIRVRNHDHEEPPSLYYSTTAGVSLNHKYPGTAEGETNEEWASDLEWTKETDQHGSHLICASEPSTKVPSQWKLIPKNHCVLMGADGRPRLESVEYNTYLNAPKSTGTPEEEVQSPRKGWQKGWHDRYGNLLHL